MAPGRRSRRGWWPWEVVTSTAKILKLYGQGFSPAVPGPR